MQAHAGDFELTMAELRAVAGYAVACAEPALVIFRKDLPDDPRPAAALQAARAFADGAPRSRLQRATATNAHRAARDAGTEAARHAAMAAGDAAASAFLHPLAKATQVRHILGAAAHATRAAELARGDDPVAAEYVITAAAKRATPAVLDVLTRYPRAPDGRDRVAVLMRRLDSLLRDPAPKARKVDDPGPFFHGTRADLRPGDLLTPGWRSNYGSARQANHIYLTATREGAPLAAALARGDGLARVYQVEPLGTIEDDPNVTDKRFPGNPTRSYRTTDPLRIIEEITGWEPPPPELIQGMRERMADLAELGIRRAAQGRGRPPRRPGTAGSCLSSRRGVDALFKHDDHSGMPQAYRAVIGFNGVDRGVGPVHWSFIRTARGSRSQGAQVEWDTCDVFAPDQTRIELKSSAYLLFPDLTLSCDDTVASGDKVAVRWTATGTHEGDQLGVPATHRKVTLTGIDIVRIANGRVVERWGEGNGLEMMQQIAPQ